MFLATLTLLQNTIKVNDRQIPLTLGVNLTAESKTGKMRVIDSLPNSVHSHVQELLRERSAWAPKGNNEF